MTKKIKYLVLFSFMILLGLCTKSQARIITNDPTVSSGGTATITISSQENVASGSIDITSNDGLTFSNASSNYGVANGSMVAFATSNNVKNGIATYTFKAPKVTKTQDFKVVFSSSDMADASGKAVASSSATATVTVKAPANSNAGNNNTGEKPSTATPSFEKVSQTVYTISEVNVRSSYSTNSSVLGTLEKGASVTRTGIGSNGWSRVSYNGSTAYVSSDYLTTTKPATTAKPKEDDDKEDKDKKEEKSHNNFLKALEVVPEGLRPNFDPNVTDYTLAVGSNIAALNIDAVTDDEKAKVKISGNKNLELGENTITITVTAEDGTKKEYTIVVLKEEVIQLGLKELLIEGLPLTPEFSEEVYEYTLNLDRSDISELNITASASRENATIEIIGNADLKPGENIITILVADGEEEEKETITYQVIVNLPILPEGNLILGKFTQTEFYQYMVIALGAIVILILLILITKKILKKRKDDIEDNDEDLDYHEVKEEPNDSDIGTLDHKTEELSDEELPHFLRKHQQEKIEENQESEEKTSQQLSKEEERKNKLDEFTAAMDLDDTAYGRRKRGKHF